MENTNKLCDLQLAKILKVSKPNLRTDPSAETFNWHLHTSTKDERKKYVNYHTFHERKCATSLNFTKVFKKLLMKPQYLQFFLKLHFIFSKTERKTNLVLQFVFILKPSYLHNYISKLNKWMKYCLHEPE